MSAERAVDVTTLVWVLAMVPALGIALSQTLLLWRLRRRRDRLWAFRVKSTLLFGSLGVAMLRNVAVWADLAWFDQRYLGPPAQRWPLDLGLAVAIALACWWAGLLYAHVQRDERKRPAPAEF